MDQIMNPIGIGIVILGFIFFVVIELKRRELFGRLESYFAQGDYDKYLECVNSKLVTFIYPKFNRLYMRLNAYIAKQDVEKASQTIDELCKTRMNKKQKTALYTKAFAFMVERGKNERAGEILELIRGLDDQALTDQCTETYEILCCKDTSRISAFEEAIKGAPTVEQSRLAYLLSVMYESKGDTKLAEQYFSRAQNSLNKAVEDWKKKQTKA